MHVVECRFSASVEKWAHLTYVARFQTAPRSSWSRRCQPIGGASSLLAVSVLGISMARRICLSRAAGREVVLPVDGAVIAFQGSVFLIFKVLTSNYLGNLAKISRKKSPDHCHKIAKTE